MHYPVAIEKGEDGQSYGVIVPDIPGCFSAGDTIEDALHQAREAIEGHLQLLAEDGLKIPKPGMIGDHAENPELAGLIWALVEVDEMQFLGRAEKINVTLPAYLITRIDKFVSTHPEFKSRSGLLAAGALKLLS